MRFIKYILLFILGACGVIAEAQETVTVNPNIVYSNTHTTYEIGGIRVSGMQDFDEAYLISISQLTVGQNIQVPGLETTEVINRYWQQGFFSNVKLEADSIVGNKIFLHIHLTPQPRISSISYSGVKKSEREDLEQRLGLQVGSQITPDMVNRAERIIKRYFEERGSKMLKSKSLSAKTSLALIRFWSTLILISRTELRFKTFISMA